MTPYYFGYLSAIVFFFCLAVTIKNVHFLLTSKADKRWYIAGKGIIVLYLGTLYGILAFDKIVYDIINYPNIDYLLLLRVGAIMASMVFAADAWLRGKLE